DAVDLGDTTLVDLLTDSFGRHAAQTAIIDVDGGTLDHAEFAARARSVAEGLRARGIGPESVVGVGLPRSVNQIVALHGVTLAGGAFLPIDPAEPAARLQHILDTARPAVVITPDGAALPDHEVDTVGLDELRTDSRPGRGRHAVHTPRAAQLHADHPAYVLFTSGSTGKPKGVIISHRSIVNRLSWMQSRYGLDSTDRVLQKTPATFDVSVWEFYW
ncbi:AMP-binding protein, partial [Streptomyces sp. SID10244]|nr:AMP-binding protein [Streptomyces sp. SID10244]